MSVSFSIIICTYNPSRELIERLFQSLENFKDITKVGYEVIIVDSNSSQPLKEDFAFKDFLSKNNAAILRVNESGLTIARTTGLRHAKHDWIIFFDDDNEPDENYISSLTNLIELYPQVACWGPGIINVEYLGKNISEFAKQKKKLFQERTTDSTKFDNNPSGSECYPPGTGLAVNKKLLNEYFEQVNSKIYSMTDRNGKKLTSGGDVQLILHCIKLGYYAGSSSTLIVNHLIKAEKLNFRHILSLNYWLSSSYIKAFNEVFPERAIQLTEIKNQHILRQFYYLLKVDIWRKGIKEGLFEFYKKLGESNARVLAANTSKQPFLLNFFESML